MIKQVKRSGLMFVTKASKLVLCLLHQFSSVKVPEQPSKRALEKGEVRKEGKKEKMVAKISATKEIREQEEN